MEAQRESVATRPAVLHWVHWAILAISLGATIAAWYVTRQQGRERIRTRFEHDCERVLALVVDRMAHYEDALWAGAGLVRAKGRTPDLETWRAFAGQLRLRERYPGISGIGIIQPVSREQKGAFIARQRVERPDFDVHPGHEQPELLPITYIEPQARNDAAVGLDMAHEANRYAAAQRARSTGAATITGPITLVQDDTKTPGFLFFAPYYTGGGSAASNAERESSFEGIVYAPFVVRELMQGVLSATQRGSAVRILDEDTVLYDELGEDEPPDPDSLFEARHSIELYGRTWDFDLRATPAFRSHERTSQPIVILVGGVLIDSVLLVLFLTMARGRSAAERQSSNLARSNAELERFVYVASHDLREPLRMVHSYLDVLGARLDGSLDEIGSRSLSFASEGAERMQNLLDDLLAYSRAGCEDRPFEAVDLQSIANDCLENLSVLTAENEAVVDVGPLPSVQGDARQLGQLFQNLISNSIKYRSEAPPRIEVRAQGKGTHVAISVQDNGQGIDPEDHDQIFAPFKRLHLREDVEGSGVGLAICAKVVERHGGVLQVKSAKGQGATFTFSLEKTHTTVGSAT